ncbi:hypothetical protein LXL04_034937 [Taraxacum kok-saghyz]
MQSESPNNSPRTAVPPKSQLRSATARSDMKKSQQLAVKSSEPETAEILSIGQKENYENMELFYDIFWQLNDFRFTSGRACTLGLDGEATEPMIKELDEDREESQDPEVEFAIAGAVREWKFCWKLFRRFKVKPGAVSRCSAAKYEETEPPYLNSGGALSLLLAFSVEPAEGILLIVESLTMEANESDNINITQNALTHFDGGRIRLFTSVEA